MKLWVSPTPAKKCLEMIASSEPKMKKSYHSNTVPAADAVSTSPIRRGASSAMRNPPARIASGETVPPQEGGIQAVLSGGGGAISLPPWTRAICRASSICSRSHTKAWRMWDTFSTSSDSGR
jgi:hypothetical protein